MIVIPEETCLISNVLAEHTICFVKSDYTGIVKQLTNYIVRHEHVDFFFNFKKTVGMKQCEMMLSKLHQGECGHIEGHIDPQVSISLTLAVYTVEPFLIDTHA